MPLTFWRSRQGGGILLIMTATLSFALLDSATRHITQLAPVLMLLWFRYAFQAVTTLVLRFPVQKASLFATPNPKFQTLRWVLMAVGLGGVLLVVRPGGQIFGWALLFPLLLVGTYAWFQVLTSRLSGDENPYTTHFYTGLVGALVMAPVLLWSWSTQALIDYWPWFLTLGFFGTFGHMMLIRAFNRASAVVLSPYLYTQIAFATLASWLFFSHVPDALAWVGIAVIAVSGVGNALLSIREAAPKRQ